MRIKLQSTTEEGPRASIALAAPLEGTIDSKSEDLARRPMKGQIDFLQALVFDTVGPPFTDIGCWPELQEQGCCLACDERTSAWVELGPRVDKQSYPPPSKV